MTKTLRMDDKGQMFVENLTEIEVQSSDEILAQYMKGMFLKASCLFNNIFKNFR